VVTYLKAKTNGVMANIARHGARGENVMARRHLAKSAGVARKFISANRK